MLLYIWLKPILRRDFNHISLRSTQNRTYYIIQKANELIGVSEKVL